VNVIRAESLHAEVVDKAIVLHKLNLILNLLVRSCATDKPKRYTETISLQISKLYGLETTLERANFNFGVPVLTSLLSNQLLCICSLNRSNLTRNPSFVLVASNVYLPWHLSDALCDVVYCVHRLNVFFVNYDLQILWNMRLSLPLSQIKLFSSSARQTSRAVDAHHS
jgi:hypothetical protein